MHRSSSLSPWRLFPVRPWWPTNCSFCLWFFKILPMSLFLLLVCCIFQINAKKAKHHLENLGMQCACVLSAGKMADCMYDHSREGALDLCNGAVSEKTPNIFDLRCPLSRWQRIHDEEKPQSPRCACAPRVNYSHFLATF